ncbi:MAG: hypothetical protein ACLTC8_10250 [Lachnospiraceae bacterium]
MAVTVYGYSGSVLYITDIRCLRDMQELLDDVDAKLEVEVGKVVASVKEVYTNVQHDYCQNGSFSDSEDAFKNWYRSNTTYITKVQDGSKNWALLDRETQTSSYYLRQIVKVPKAGPFTVRFKAKCGEGQTSRIRIYFAGTNKYTDAGSVTETYKTFELEFDNVTANSWYFYVYNYTSGTKVYITDIEILGYISGYSESQLQVLKDSIESEVSRATAGEDKLSSSIKQNATAITSKVSKGEMGSYITQYYNNVIIAFNKNSKYVQINPGEIAIYNYGVENSKKRAVFDETGNHFYRDGYYVGTIGTNQWSGNNAHKGLVFDLEPQGKYMAFAQKASSSATSYTTMLCFSRANSIYDEYGVNMGCNLIGNWYTLKNFKIGSISAGGYTAFSGAIPIVCEITNNGNSWTYSHLRVYNGIIVGYWN